MAEMPSADLNLNFGMLIFDSSTAKSQNLITGRAAGSGMEGEGGQRGPPSDMSTRWPPPVGARALGGPDRHGSQMTWAPGLAGRGDLKIHRCTSWMGGVTSSFP